MVIFNRRREPPGRVCAPKPLGSAQQRIPRQSPILPSSTIGFGRTTRAACKTTPIRSIRLPQQEFGKRHKAIACKHLKKYASLTK